MKIVLILLALNFIADQLFQHPDIMKGKHKDSTVLFVHVLTWSISTFLFASIVALKTWNVNVYSWWLTTFVIHYAVEWCCLRMWTNYFYDNKRTKMVGWILLEQLIINSSMVAFFIYFMNK